VDIDLADGTQYEEGQLYAREKRIYFAHDIQDLARGTTWKAVEECVQFMKGTVDLEICFGLVKLHVDGTITELRNEHASPNHQINEDWLDEQIKSGDVIEVRLKAMRKFSNNANCFEMRLIRVNQTFSETYNVGRASLPDSATCEFTHYIYAEPIAGALYGYLMLLHKGFLSDNEHFPLVDFVTHSDCRQVIRIRPTAEFKARRFETIWEYGQDLELSNSRNIDSEDVIEIRVLKFTLPVVYMPSDDGECEVAQNTEQECNICLHNKRDVVFDECGHCCVCRKCLPKMRMKMCPACYKPYIFTHMLKDWIATKGEPIYSTRAMDDVYSLLTSLERHCVEDTQVDDLLRK
jgi:hypothetical protein